MRSGVGASRARVGRLREKVGSVASQKIMAVSYLGRHREAQEEGNRAIGILRELLAESPNNANVLALLGYCYDQMLTAANDFTDRRAVIRLAPLARGEFQRLAAKHPSALEPPLN